MPGCATASCSRGVAIGNTSTDNCEVAEQVPESARPSTGRVSGRGRGQSRRRGVDTAAILSPVDGYLTQLKLLGSRELPWWGIRMSGTYQNLPGNVITAHVIYTGAQILAANPSLGAFSSGAAGQVTVNVLEPGTVHASGCISSTGGSLRSCDSASSRSI